MLPGTGALVGRWPTRLVPRRQRDVASGQFAGPSSLGHAKANGNLAEGSFSVTPGRGRERLAGDSEDARAREAGRTVGVLDGPGAGTAEDWLDNGIEWSRDLT